MASIHIRLAVGVVQSRVDPFQPEPRLAPHVWFTIRCKPAPDLEIQVHDVQFTRFRFTALYFDNYL